MKWKCCGAWEDWIFRGEKIMSSLKEWEGDFMNWVNPKDTQLLQHSDLYYLVKTVQ